jgi:hypothetical protein
MKEVASTSETSLISTRIYDATSQKTVIFIPPSGPQISQEKQWLNGCFVLDDGYTTLIRNDGNRYNRTQNTTIHMQQPFQ